MTSRNDWNAQKILYLALASLMQVLYPGGIGILSVGFCVGRKPETPNKKTSKQGENQQQIQPTYGTGAE